MIESPTAHRQRLPSAPVAACLLLLTVVLAVALAITALQGTHNHAKAAQLGSHADPLTRVGLGHGGPNSHLASSAGPSGVAVPTGNLPGWKQVFRDNFSTPVPTGGFSGCKNGPTIMTSICSGLPASVASKLWAYPDGWSDNHHGRYEPSQVLSIHNGVLDFDLHTSNGVHMVAAVMPKIPGGVGGDGLLYGAYVVRFRADLLPGYKTAFLLWPDSERWPADGEIDFPEGRLNGTMQAAMHYMGGTSLTSQDVYRTDTGYGRWHTAVIEWSPQLCRFIVDGRVVGTSVSLIPSTPMHWVLQAETVGGATAPASNVSGHIYVAWIAAYKRAVAEGSA